MQSDYNALNQQEIITIFFKEDCMDEKNQLSISKQNAMLLKIFSEIQKRKEEGYYV